MCAARIEWRGFFELSRAIGPTTGVTSMKRPPFPMQFGDTGDTVAELHQALEQLGISVTASEVGAKLYGTDTKRKVSAFQGASGIPRTAMLST